MADVTNNLSESIMYPSENCSKSGYWVNLFAPPFYKIL